MRRSNVVIERLLKTVNEIFTGFRKVANSVL